MARRRYSKPTPKPKTMDEMYQEYVDSLEIPIPSITDFGLTQTLKDCIDNPKILELENKKREEQSVDSAFNLLRKKFKYVAVIAGFLLPFSTLLFLYLYFEKEFDVGFIVGILIFSWMITPFISVLFDFFIEKIIKAHIRKNPPTIEKIIITNIDLNKNKAYLDALNERENTIKNIKIPIQWSDVRFKDGQISVFVPIFQKTFYWSIERSKSDYDKYRIILMDRFPDLFFWYGDGHLRIYTNKVDDAIVIIINYINKNAAAIKAQEEEEKKKKEEIDRINKEREERERKEREEREREEREKERKEKEKLMNDFYSSHPYFTNEHDKQDALRTKIKVEKSVFLNYLMEHQLDGIDIMSVREDRRTATMLPWQFPDIQNGYIFTLKMNATEYCLVYENVFDNNASIKYINSSLLTCLETAMDIKLHMQGKTPNKREKIASTRKIGEHRVRRIMHDDFYDWKQKLHSRTFR